jgi:nanoRNase/pAp phosphatase (c-di-AMP/oligoRNAs hydrolase)
MKKIVVVYHKNCLDGFTAAWAAWKKFGNKAEYIAVDPRQLPNRSFKKREIYILDSSLPPPSLKKLLKDKNEVFVIDHHLSSERDVKSAPHHVFDLNHSGAALAWQYFHGTKPMPKIVLYAEDFDLWKFKLKHTKEIVAALSLFEFNFKTWDRIAKALERSKTKQKFVEDGKIIIAYENKLVERIAKNAQLVNFQGVKTLAVNSPILESLLGHYLCKKLPPMAIVWREKNAEKVFSLRSDGSLDVSKIAKKYRGGGHKASAGFALPRGSKLPWKILKPDWLL